MGLNHSRLWRFNLLLLQLWLISQTLREPVQVHATSGSDVHVVVNYRSSYNDAVTRCRAMGYDGLAVAVKESRMEVIWGAINSATSASGTTGDYFWIGMQYSDISNSYVWDNGAILLPWVSTMWRSWSSNNTGSCVILRSDSYISPADCDNKRHFTCQNYGALTNTFTLRAENQKAVSTIGYTNVLWADSTRSSTECCYNCLEHDTCKFAIHEGDNSLCTLITSDFSIQDDTEYANGSKIYARGHQH